MRQLGFSIVLVIALAAVAHAEPYPQIIVDRPLIMDDGMTSIGAALDLPTYLIGLSTHTTFGDNREVDASVAHSVGPVQFAFSVATSLAGPLLGAGSRWYAGPGAVELDLGVRLPATGFQNEYRQSLRYTVKTVALPHTLAFYANGGVEADEYNDGDDHLVSAVVGGGVELQVTDELELTPYGYAFASLADTMDVPATANIGAQATYVLDRFDIYANVALLDVRDARLPFASFGFTARFGR